MGWNWRNRKLRLAGAAAVFAALGAIAGLCGAFVGGYGWFTENAEASRASNLTPQQAEEFARNYAIKQLRLAQPQIIEMQNVPGGQAIPLRHTPETEADRPFVTIEATFLAYGDTTSPGAAVMHQALRPAGAWLFVFRAGGVEVAEWDTHNAVFEVQVLLSDRSGRVLQSGSTLLPEIQPETAAVHR